ERAPQGRVFDRRFRANDRIGDPDVSQNRAALDRYVGADLDVLEGDTLGDAHGPMHANVRAAFGIEGTAGALPQMAVGLEQGVDLAGVVPAFDGLDAELCTAVDHVLEGVGQVVLGARAARALARVLDPLEEQRVIADVVEADVRELRDGILRLLDDALHVAVAVGDDDTEALVVLDLLGPDHAREVLGQALNE